MQAIDYLYNNHDLHVGWFIPIAQKHIGNSNEFKVDFFDELAIPRSLLDFTKLTYTKVAEWHKLDPYDSFVYFARKYLCPLMESCNLSESPSQVTALTAMFACERDIPEVREFCEQHIPSIVKMWDIYDDPNSTVKQMPEATWRAITAGQTCALFQALAEEITKFEGNRKRTVITKEDFLYFETVISRTPAAMDGYDPALIYRALHLRTLAVEIYNKRAAETEFPALPQGDPPRHNDNDFLNERFVPN